MAILAAFQRRLIYFPDSTPVPGAGEVIEGARDVTLRTSDGIALGAWFVPPSPVSDLHLGVLGRRRGAAQQRGPVAVAAQHEP